MSGRDQRSAELIAELLHPELPDCVVARVFENVTRGLLSLVDGQQMVARDVLEEPLSKAVVEDLCSRAQEWVTRDYVTAYNLAGLLRAALLSQAASGLRLSAALEVEVVICFVDAAAAYLPHAPDPNAFRDAATVVAYAKQACETMGLATLRGRAYVAGARLLAYYSRAGIDVDLWDLPLAERSEHIKTLPTVASTSSVAGERSAAERIADMPDPRKDAERLIAEVPTVAPTLAEPHRAAYLVQTLRISEYCAVPPKGFRLRAAAEALALRQHLSLEDRLAAAEALAEGGESLPCPAAELFDEPFPALLDRVGPGALISAWAGTVNLLKTLCEHELLASFARQLASIDLPAVAQFPPDLERVLFDMVRAMDAGGLDCIAADAAATESMELRRCIPHGLSDRQQFWTELHAAYHAATLRIAEELMQTRMLHVEPELRALAVQLKRFVRRGAARSTWRNRRDAWDELLPAVLTDLRETAGLGLDETNVWRRLEILVREQPAKAPRVLDGLLPVFDQCLGSYFDHAERAAADCGEAINDALIQVPPATIQTSLTHAQLFKGRRLALAMAHSGPFRFPATAQMSTFELTRDEHDVLAAHLPADALAMSYAENIDTMVGGTVTALVSNYALSMNHTFGRTLLADRIAEARRSAASHTSSGLRRHGMADIDTLLKHLGPDTALIDILTGTLGGEQVAFASLYSRALSLRFKFRSGHDRTRIVMLPDADGIQPRRTTFHEDFRKVSVLRELIRDDPGPRRPVVREASEFLDDTIIALIAEHTFGRLTKAGVHRLAIWSQGALHYAPLHLFSAPETPLADQWTVTYLPTLEVILRPTPTAPGHEDLVLAASSRGGTPFSLTAVPGLDDQIEEVAACASRSMPVQTVHDASVRDVLSRVSRARYVHLAAHGAADPLAPWSQCLYLGDGRSRSERLHAYQVLEADWRGVHLVTLAACETAMGRFDRLDNLVGLTSALLAAGVRAVVAAMWPVRPEPAAAFFVNLYRRLAAESADPEQADLRAAFREAQVSTRQVYPAYRDWAAFAYIGGW